MYICSKSILPSSTKSFVAKWKKKIYHSMCLRRTQSHRHGVNIPGLINAFSNENVGKILLEATVYVLENLI